MTEQTFIIPKAVDILGGRSNHAFRHAGNVKLRRTVVELLETYHNKTKRKDKINMIRGVLQDIQDEGGKFLKYAYDKGKWYDAGFVEARTKISHTFRDASIPNKIKCLEPMKLKAMKMRKLTKLKAPEAPEPLPSFSNVIKKEGKAGRSKTSRSPFSSSSVSSYHKKKSRPRAASSPTLVVPTLYESLPSPGSSAVRQVSISASDESNDDESLVAVRSETEESLKRGVGTEHFQPSSVFSSPKECPSDARKQSAHVAAQQIFQSILARSLLERRHRRHSVITSCVEKTKQSDYETIAPRAWSKTDAPLTPSHGDSINDHDLFEPISICSSSLSNDLPYYQQEKTAQFANQLASFESLYRDTNLNAVHSGTSSNDCNELLGNRTSGCAVHEGGSDLSLFFMENHTNAYF